MKKVFFKVFSVFIVMSLLAMCAFALVACNTSDKNNTSDNEEEIDIIDQTDLFEFIPNYDGKSYMAELHIERNEILPTKIFIPSHYNGVPVTAFSIKSHDLIHNEDLLTIEYLYIPETITGGCFAIYSAYQYTYVVKNNNAILGLSDGGKINGKKYSYTSDFVEEVTGRPAEKYNDLYSGAYVGVIFLPQAAS